MQELINEVEGLEQMPLTNETEVLAAMLRASEAFDQAHQFAEGMSANDAPKLAELVDRLIVRGKVIEEAGESSMHDHPADNQQPDCVDFTRASGEQLCTRCEKPYRKHPLEQSCQGFQGAFLRKLCDGRLVKL